MFYAIKIIERHVSARRAAAQTEPPLETRALTSAARPEMAPPVSIPSVSTMYLEVPYSPLRPLHATRLVEVLSAATHT